MNDTEPRAPASVAENIEKIIRIESEALQPPSRSVAITDAIGGLCRRDLIRCSDI